MACLLVLFHVHRNLLLLVLSYLFVSVFLVRLAFGKMTAARTVMHLLLYYACAFILAGLLLQAQKSFHYPLTGASMLGLMLFVLFLLRYFMPKLKKEKERVSYLYRLRIYDRGNKIEGMALLDTGNGLYDAISKKPVMLGSKKFLEKLWKGKDPPLMRMIPYHWECFVLFGHNDWKLNVGETGSLWKMRGWRSAKNVFLWMENTK